VSEAAQAEGAEAPAEEAPAAEASPTADGTAPEAQAPAAAEPANDWRASIEDETLAGLAGRYNSPADVVKALAETQRTLSTRIKLPGEDASEEDLAKFRKAVGVPDTANDYVVNRPDGLPQEEFDAMADGLKSFAEIAHQNGVPKAGYEALAGAYLQQRLQDAAAVNQRDAEARRAAEADLRRAWGESYDRNAQFAAEFAGETGIDQIELKDGTLLGSHPAFIKLAAEAGRVKSNGVLTLGMQGTEAGAGIQERYDELTNQMYAAMDRGNHSEAQRLDNERRPLSEQLFGQMGIVGAPGRVS
jgi:hypothetical protein